MDNIYFSYKKLAREITVVENELPGYEQLLESLPPSNTPIIGVTGAPGAGKSSLVNALIREILKQNKKLGIIAVDPTSPFNYGSLLGDRVRMSEHFTNQQVFIRSLATRGSLGGLSEKIIEVGDVMKSGGFDFVIVETVGVGQSEVEIAGLADVSIVVLTPDGGDEVQSMKSGIMEIADIFVVNKADRPNADGYAKNLEKFVHEKNETDWTTPVIKTVATEFTGIDLLLNQINLFFETKKTGDKRTQLLTDKAFRLIQKKRMSDLDKNKLGDDLKLALLKPDFNLYSFIKKFPKYNADPRWLPVATQYEPYDVELEADRKYSWCTCGLSDKEPFCDSKHKQVEGMPFRSLKFEVKEKGVYSLCGCKQTKTPPFCDDSHLCFKKQ